MKARSGFLHTTPQAAVEAAIRVADGILTTAANPPATRMPQFHAA
jgi:hypothetical protein